MYWSQIDNSKLVHTSWAWSVNNADIEYTWGRALFSIKYWDNSIKWRKWMKMNVDHDIVIIIESFQSYVLIKYIPDLLQDLEWRFARMLKREGKYDLMVVAAQIVT